MSLAQQFWFSFLFLFLIGQHMVGPAQGAVYMLAITAWVASVIAYFANRK